MQIATLALAGLSAAASVGCFLIMAKTAKDLRETKARVEADVVGIKTKVSHNAGVVRAALGALEL